MPADDIAGQVTPPSATPGAFGGPLDFRPPAQQKPGAAPAAAAGPVQYDADGYPLPSAQQIAAYKEATKLGTATSGGANPAIGGYAYDPTMGPPQAPSDNPYPPGDIMRGRWDRLNAQKKYNQDAKQSYQKQHEGQRQAQPAAPQQSAAPATPFQSSGIDLTKQGKGESYIDSILGSYQQSGVPQVGNESKQTLDKFRSSQPANMDPYYDHASELASAKIDNAMAARGSYGSSNATGQIGAAEVSLRAQQARDNASYGLSRFSQEGSLAGAADQQQNVGNGIQFQWTKGLGDMANKSQELGENRNQSLWNNNFQLAAAKAGIYGAGAQGAIGSVDAATDAAINAKQGVATNALSNANANANASNGATAGLLNAANQGVSNYTRYNSGKTN